MASYGRIGIAFGLVLLVAAPALAQPPQRGRGGPGGGMMGGPGMLLQNEGVQKELKLTEDQVKKCHDALQEVRKKHEGDFAKIRDMNEQERGDLMKSVREETTKALAGILQPDQEKRLKQINWQRQNAQAFSDPEVQSALKLTDDQKGQLKTIGDDANKARREAFQNAQGGDRDAARKQMETLNKETMEKVTAVLTDDQKKAWKDLVGEPFHFQPQGGRGGQRRQERGTP
jgi:Spy/CpxP family protein refolding chaperone